MKNTKKIVLSALALLSALTIFSAGVFTTAYASVDEPTGNTAVDDFLKKHKDDNKSENKFKIDMSGESTIDTNNSDVRVNNTNTNTNTTLNTNNEVQLSEGWNTPNNDPSKVCIVKNGVKQTGWVNAGTGWHYFDENGYMKANQWIENGGNYYFVDSTGDMMRNVLVDGHFIGGDGIADASKNNFSVGDGIFASTTLKEGGYYLLHSDSSLSSSREVTNRELSSLNAQGKLGVTVTHATGMDGSEKTGIDWYVK